MVNIVTTLEKLIQSLVKMVGIIPHKIEVEAGTILNIWIPNETIEKKPKKTNCTTQDQNNVRTTKPTKPVVVLLHGFCGNGILTWALQAGLLAKKYSVYVPDLLFFGGSVTDNPDRSLEFQADCMVKGLRKLGIEKCRVVGFSYGGMVAFKMAKKYPELVEALVISGAVPMTDSIITDILKCHGFSSMPELLLPDTFQKCKALLKSALYKKTWFIPDCCYKVFLEVMYNNRMERSELLEKLVVCDDDNVPKFSQKIHFLWGENDNLTKIELGKNLKEKLGGKNITIQGIRKAGHLAHIDRPFFYDRCLKQFLHQSLNGF